MQTGARRLGALLPPPALPPSPLPTARAPRTHGAPQAGAQRWKARPWAPAPRGWSAARRGSPEAGQQPRGAAHGGGAARRLPVPGELGAASATGRAGAAAAGSGPGRAPIGCGLTRPPRLAQVPPLLGAPRPLPRPRLQGLRVGAWGCAKAPSNVRVPSRHRVPPEHAAQETVSGPKVRAAGGPGPHGGGGSRAPAALETAHTLGRGGEGRRPLPSEVPASRRQGGRRARLEPQPRGDQLAAGQQGGSLGDTGDLGGDEEQPGRSAGRWWPLPLGEGWRRRQ